MAEPAMTVDADFLIKVATILLSLVALVLSLVASRKKQIDARFKEGRDRMDRQATRIVQLEAAVKTLPEKEDIHRLQLELTRMAGSMAEIKQMMAGNDALFTRMESVVARHEQYLLGGGK